MNVRLAGARLTRGALIPVPVSAMVCGLPAALSVTVTEPVLAPSTVGVKRIEIVQVPAGAIDAPQLLVRLKSPVATILEIVNAAEPELVSVTTWVALAMFRA